MVAALANIRFFGTQVDREAVDDALALALVAHPVTIPSSMPPIAVRSGG